MADETPKYEHLSGADTLLTMDSAVRHYPALAEMPEHVRMILAMKAYGLSSTTIATELGLTAQKVSQAVVDYDPERKYVMSVDARKSVMAQGITRLMMEALGVIRPEDIREMKPDKAIKFIGECANILRTLDARPEQIAPNPNDAMRRLVTGATEKKEGE